MRRGLVAAVVLAAALLTGFTGCNPAPSDPQPVSEADLAVWTHVMVDVTPPASPPPLLRQVLNTGIRTTVPVVCPALAAQAAETYRPFVTATCAGIVASDDPFTTATQVLPALCAGDPPLGATVYPQHAPALVATCPLIRQLPPLLGLTQYVPLFGTPAGTG